MKKLRLILFTDCERSCSGCCNKDFDLENLPRLRNFEEEEWGEILITGGEPLLNPSLVKGVIQVARQQSSAHIYVYTAKTSNVQDLLDILYLSDGITVTLHEQEDVFPFMDFVDSLIGYKGTLAEVPFHPSCEEILTCCETNREEALIYKRNLRLNIFAGIKLTPIFRIVLDQLGWKIKENIEWLSECPLPENEVLMRLF